MKSTWGHRVSGVTLALVVVVVAVSTPAGAALGAGPVTSAPPALSDGAFARQAVNADSVSLRADLLPNGTASWTIQYRIRLQTENDSAAFADLRDDIAANRSAYVTQFADRLSATAASAENATGRSMSIRNVSVTTSRQQIGTEYGYGFVTYRFRWTGFAASEDGDLVAGDALAGFYLDADTALTIGWPEGYEATTVTPTPTSRQSRSATWQGERSFGPNEPRVVVASAGGGGPSPLLLAAGVVVALTVLIGAAWVVRRRRGSEEEAPPRGESTDVGTANGAAAVGQDEARKRTETGDDAAGTEGEEPDPDLLSNEERVLRLLDDHGGRIKQQKVAEELDWTAAKTSQVVTGMREAGDVEVFRLGRENVIRLPEEGGEE